MRKLTSFLITVVFSTLALASPGKFPDISHEELKSAIAAKSVVVLDVNGTHEYEKGHIPGAVDYVANRNRLAQVLPKNKNALIVAYCLNEECPAYALAANAAVKLGYTNVKHYSPGIEGWKESGAAVDKTS